MNIMGKNKHPSLQSIYEQPVLRQAQKILAHPSQTCILHVEFELLPSGKQYRTPNCEPSSYKTIAEIVQ